MEEAWLPQTSSVTGKGGLFEQVQPCDSLTLILRGTRASDGSGGDAVTAECGALGPIVAVAHGRSVSLLGTWFPRRWFCPLVFEAGV